MEISEILQKVIDNGASDLHLTVGSPPILRVNGHLTPLPGSDVLSPEQVEALIHSLLTEEQKGLLTNQLELDFSFSLRGQARFRVNAYHQRGYLSAALRLIPLRVPTLEELNLPRILYDFCNLRQGFVLVTGPTGQGKSTTIAAMLDYINENRRVHIITIEDPIEYIYPHKQSLIEQREMHLDTGSWGIALRSVLREDPDVVLVGEMRDLETISAAITIAETGHLVFATLHTNSAAQTIDRIIDVFPENQQPQIRIQLASIIEGVVSQRLVPALSGGRVPAVEVLLATGAVRNVIREGKTHQIDNIISTSGESGMFSMDQSLSQLVKGGRISMETGRSYSLHPEEFLRLVKTTG
ncbi:MAG: type IV pilus twitching motility protein PilT [Patescibacteria group bacterium]